MIGKKSFSKKSDIAVGIDIGNFAVKVVHLSRKQEVFTLEGFGYSKFNSSRPEDITEAIKGACAEARISHPKVNAAIPSEGVIVRYLTLPNMSGEELKNAMDFEIERYVPFERSEVASDYLVLKKNEETKNIKVLLVAAKKGSVDERVRLLKGAGLEPEVITIDSIVIKNTFQLNYPDKLGKTIGLLNIGAKTTNINIIKDETSYFMRDLQLGGDSITQLLKEKLEIDVQEAEKIKCDLVMEDKEKFKIVEPVLGNLLNEAYLSFDYYESEFGIVVEEVFISGGTSKLSWLASFLKENLNREITVLDPVNALLVSPAVSKESLAAASCSLNVSVGLALESFV